MIQYIVNQYRSAYSGIPRKIWLIFLVIFVNRSGHMVLFFMMLYLTKELAFTVSVAGELTSISGLGFLAFVLAPKAGTYIYQHWSPQYLWYGIGILGIFTYVALRILQKRA